MSSVVVDVEVVASLLPPDSPPSLSVGVVELAAGGGWVLELDGLLGCCSMVFGFTDSGGDMIGVMGREIVTIWFN